MRSIVGFGTGIDGHTFLTMTEGKIKIKCFGGSKEVAYSSKISVIVPIYNAEKYLEKCIKSIILQTYSNLQIILIDDGSTDSSGDICDRYAQEDKCIEVYHTENGGSVAARKRGLEKADGEYIGFVDADDYIEPDMFSELLQDIQKCGADFVHFGFLEERGGAEKVICNFEEKVADVCDISCRNAFLCDHFFDGGRNFVFPSIWSKLFKAELIKKCFFPLPDEQQYGEDLLCLLRCILESRRIALKQKALYHYVVKERSLAHLENRERVLNDIGLWYHITNTLREYECLEAVKENVTDFLRGRMLQTVEYISKRQLSIPQYFLKDIPQITGKRIIIYGAGRVGQDYYAQIARYQNCDIVAWVDLNWQKYHFEYAEVISMEKMTELSFDMVIIAVKDGNLGMKIRSSLVKAGIPAEKLYWQEPEEYF